MMLLDYIIIHLDKKAGDIVRYIWIPLDVCVLLVWTFSMVWSHHSCVNTVSTHVAGHIASTLIHIFKAVITEAVFAYMSWGLYSIVLVAKILRIFSESGFGESLPNKYQGNTGSSDAFGAQVLFTPTGITMVLSMTGINFALLTYSHHSEIDNSKYKQVIEELSHSASLDILDGLMLLSYLFIQQSGLLLPFPMDHAIQAFTCFCILLPIVPLFVLRCISNRQDEKTFMTFQKVSVLNSALYLFLVDIPVFSLRIFLWIRHDADVTTFLTKNVMDIVRDVTNVFLNVRAWLKDQNEPRYRIMEQQDIEIGEINEHEQGHTNENDHASILISDEESETMMYRQSTI